MGYTRRQSLALIGAGAAAAGLASPALAARKTVIGALHLGSHAGSFVAMDRGYFRQAGLNAELKFFQAAEPMAVAIASGDVDFGVTAITGGLLSLAQKGAIKVIGGALSEEKGIPGQMILASDKAFKAGLTDPAKLNGKRYGMTTAGSSFQYMGSKIAEKEGVKVTFVPLHTVGAVIGALKTGQIDAWSIVPNVGAVLTHSGAAHEIGRVSDFLPDYQVTTVFTSTKHATKDVELTKAFMAGFAKGVADFDAALVDKTAGDAARDAMVKLIHGYVYADKSLAAATPGILAGAMRLNRGAALNTHSVKDQIAWFESEKLIRGEIGFDMLVDPSYAPMV